MGDRRPSVPLVSGYRGMWLTSSGKKSDVQNPRIRQTFQADLSGQVATPPKHGSLHGGAGQHAYFRRTISSQEKEERKGLGNMLSFFSQLIPRSLTSPSSQGKSWGAGWKDARNVTCPHTEGNLKNRKEALPPNTG